MIKHNKKQLSDDVSLLIQKVLMSRSRPGYQALATYCGVSYSWVAKFAQAEVPDPKISVVLKLQAYFDANPVESHTNADSSAGKVNVALLKKKQLIKKSIKR